MSHARARRAIEVKLAVWADARPIMVAYGAEPFTPPEAETYLRAFMLPASAVSRYLGSDAIEYRGVYQVSIVCPAGTAISIAEEIIDDLDLLFPIDSGLERAGFEGNVVQPVGQGPTITEPDRFTVPVSFTYLGQAPTVTT